MTFLETALPPGAGDHDVRIPNPADPATELAVSLRIPDKPAGAPLVMVLHYGGPPIGFYGRGLLEQLILPAWHTLGAVFVAPVIDGDRWQSEPNIATVRALTEACAQRYATRAEACYLVGYSLGAIGAWHWLGEPSNPFRAVVPVAGRVPDTLARFDVPTFAVHSDADRLFPCAEVVARCEGLRAGGSPLTWRIVTGVDHFDVGGFRGALSDVARWLETLT